MPSITILFQQFAKQLEAHLGSKYFWTKRRIERLSGEALGMIADQIDGKQKSL